MQKQVSKSLIFLFILVLVLWTVSAQTVLEARLINDKSYDKYHLARKEIYSNVSFTKTYRPSIDIIGNPERGLQKYSITASNYSITPGANNLALSTLNSWKNGKDKVRVIFRYFLLEDFMNSNINATYLNNMQRDFDNIRTAGLKVIVRFSYSDMQGTSPQQPTKSIILSHISQIASLLEANQDVIFSHQAGFIGTWGEWYYTNSSEFGTAGKISNIQWANRKAILDAMLAATPEEIPIQVRYTGIKSQLYGSIQLTPQSAYQNTANARIGFYNDAFLNNWGDQGTYGVNRECQDPVGNGAYDYLSNETQYLPMTGETNGLNPCNNGFRTTGANAIFEMDITNWTTLNRDYHPDFWNQIIASNLYDEILRRLGYRFVLQSSTLKVNGMDFDLTLNLSNEGFARVFKERDVYLILKNTKDNSIFTHLIDTDIRTWENSLTITQNINPGVTGTFQLYLWMPDPASSLINNPDYSIRFANQNIWQGITGYNDLLQSVSLTCSATSSIDTQTACGSFTWIDGTTYSTSNNTATYILTGINGCDSVVTLDLTILNPTRTTDTQTVCGSFTWIDGKTYSTSNNTATYILAGTNGCDSVVTLNLTINNISDISTSTSGFTITANNTNASYQWVDCTNSFSSIDGATNRSLITSANGEYAVILTENGCQDTSTCVSMIVTDLFNLKINPPFHIFPNPLSDRLFIQNPQIHSGIIEIFDLSGKIWMRETLNDVSAQINIAKLSRGTYFVRIRSEKNIVTEKVIKL